MQDQVKQIRVEIDYGIKYMEKTIADASPYTKLAFRALQMGKMQCGVILEHAGALNPYPSSDDPSSKVIEPEADTVNFDDVTTEEYDDVQHAKYMRNGIKDIRAKIVKIRISPLNGVFIGPENQIFGTKAIEDAARSLKEARMWLGMELGRIAKENPGMFPTEEAKPEATEEVREVPEEVKTTDEIMTGIAEEKTPPVNVEVDKDFSEEPQKEAPITGADYLPGGRMYTNKESEGSQPALTEPASEEPVEEKKTLTGADFLPGGSEYNPADVNQDGVVDEKDLSEVHKAYHKEKEENSSSQQDDVENTDNSDNPSTVPAS